MAIILDETLTADGQTGTFTVKPGDATQYTAVIRYASGTGTVQLQVSKDGTNFVNVSGTNSESTASTSYNFYMCGPLTGRYDLSGSASSPSIEITLADESR